jgi:hypothetical protein
MVVNYRLMTDDRRQISAKISFMRRTVGYSLSDSIKIKLRDLQVPQITECREYRENWKEHVRRMTHDRIPKTLQNINQRKRSWENL